MSTTKNPEKNSQGRAAKIKKLSSLYDLRTFLWRVLRYKSFIVKKENYPKNERK